MVLGAYIYVYVNGGYPTSIYSSKETIVNCEMGGNNNNVDFTLFTPNEMPSVAHTHRVKKNPYFIIM